MEPTGGIGCRFWEDDLGRSSAVCVSIFDDDVVGHAFAPEHTATVTMSWTEDSTGERQITLRSEDPDAQSVLADLLIRTNGESSDRPATAR
jgi:hypothetical protein